MPNFTKQAIEASFIKLLNQRPLNQITVKDVVEDCGVNRNTFYYHFRDLHALIEELVTEEANAIIGRYPAIESIEQCMDVAVEFAMTNKRAVLHIYNSTDRNLFEKYLMQVCQTVVSTYVDTILRGREVAPEDRAVIVRFYKCACFGHIIEWMDGGMREDIRVPFHRLCQLKKGAVEEFLQETAP